jgi:lipid A disaccharide synthetase
MADLANGQTKDSCLGDGEWVALLPGSKRAKLQVGMPFLLQTADCLARLRPGCRFLLPVAPTTSVAELMAFAGLSNTITTHFGGGEPTLERSQDPNGRDILRTSGGQAIVLVQEHPAHALLSQCSLALTTVGANTAELGALGLPMLVLLPTQHLEVMQAWDGWMGLIARLPLLRRFVGVALTAWRLRNRGFLAWPNISAGRSVVPEHVGSITPACIAAKAAQWLCHPEKLALVREDLRSLRGKPGAVKSIAEMVVDLLPPRTIQPRGTRSLPMDAPELGSP